jgi:hypothetical protein
VTTAKVSKRKSERMALAVSLVREQIVVAEQKLEGARWNNEARRKDRKRKRDECEMASERALVVEDEIESLVRVSILEELGQEEYEGELGEYEAKESEAVSNTKWNSNIGGEHDNTREWSEAAVIENASRNNNNIKPRRRKGMYE